MFDLITKTGNQLTINKEVETLLDNYTSAKEELETAEKELRKAILEAMINNNIISTNVGKYTLSQIVPKAKEVFNSEEFITNENEDVVNAVTNIQDTTFFDVETFMKENPEMYNKYLKHKYEYNIDTKKLQDFLPNIYKKYLSIQDSDRQISLRITKKRGK